MAIKEVVYIGRSNVIKLRLLSGTTKQDLTSVTRMTLEVGEETVDSDVDTGVFDWDTEATEGIVSIVLGDALTTETGGYVPATLTVYDPQNSDGLTWEYSPEVSNLLLTVKNP